jgi:23S rRNA-/tRNA-specific pseudouridylate synthase
MSVCAAQMLHRLDLCTTGVLALARTTEAARQFTADMTMHQIKKQYKVRAHTVWTCRHRTTDPHHSTLQGRRAALAFCSVSYMHACLTYCTAKLPDKGF